MTPNAVVVGKAVEVLISGFATQWSGSPTVNFGAGVTVSKVVVASDTALLATISVAADAAPGGRDVTVSSGSQTLTFKGGFKLLPVLESSFYGSGEQLSVNLVRIRTNDLDVALPQQSSYLRLNAPVGISGGLFQAGLIWLDVAIAIDADAATGTADLGVVLFPGQPQERTLPVKIGVKAKGTPVSLTEGMMTTASIAMPYSSQAFSFTPATTDDYVIIAEGPGARPVFIVYDSTGKLSNAVGDSTNPLVNLSMGQQYFIVLWPYSGATGNFKLGAYPTAPVLSSPTAFTESEPNDDLANANQVATLPAEIDGTMSTTDTVDFFKITVSAADVGKHLLFVRQSGSADFTVTVLSADGSKSYGTSGNLYYDKVFVSEPLPAAGDYIIKTSRLGYSSYTYVIGLL